MNIGGALALVGRDLLSSVSWGETVIGVCNVQLSDANQILITDTGNQAIAKLYTLEDGVQIKVLSIELGSLDGINDPHDKTPHVKLGAVMLSLCMAVIGVFITFMYSGGEVSDEDSKAALSILYQALKSLIEIVNS